MLASNVILTASHTKMQSNYYNNNNDKNNNTYDNTVLFPRVILLSVHLAIADHPKLHPQERERRHPFTYYIISIYYIL